MFPTSGTPPVPQLTVATESLRLLLACSEPKTNQHSTGFQAPCYVGFEYLFLRDYPHGFEEGNAKEDLTGLWSGEPSSLQLGSVRRMTS
jgi:hypothetical protein